MAPVPCFLFSVSSCTGSHLPTYLPTYLSAFDIVSGDLLLVYLIDEPMAWPDGLTIIIPRVTSLSRSSQLTKGRKAREREKK